MNGPVVLLAALLALVPVGAAADTEAAGWTLSADTWARPRSGDAVVTMPPLPAVVRAWSRRSGGRLVIRYAGGEAGEIWSSELADWLVALGVPGRAIVTRPGGRPGALKLSIEAGTTP